MSSSIYIEPILGAVLGAVLGSFFSATVWAWLNDKEIPLTRSICDHCGISLPALTLIPLFSYIFLKGKCRHCGGKIPVFHFILEVIPAALGALITCEYGLGWLGLCYIILATALTAASAADILVRRLPDFISLGSLVLLPPVLVFNPSLDLYSSLIGYLTAGGIPLLLHLVFSYLRHKQGLGLGDVKLFALAGAFLGPLAIPPLFLLSSVGGILVLFIISLLSDRQIWTFRLPFGPFISASFLLLLIFPSLLTDFYALIPRPY